MRFAVESWSPEYGAATEGELDDVSGDVDAGVELDPDRWEPRTPAGPVGGASTGSIGFVDGVRRIDARVWITDGESARPGVCASVAAGLVVCEGGRARVADVAVHRVVAARTVPGDELEPIDTAHGRYEAVAVGSDDAEALYLAIHEQMTSAELALSARVDCDTVVFDGPLRGRRTSRGVGYVKTQHRRYLPDPAQAVVGRLAAGQRTPVFLIAGRFARWSWYLRLPGPVPHPLAGVVRCELVAEGTAADAVARADAVSAVLPRFASAAHKDGRAPQNLYPIAGLEHELRHRLGDPLLLERALRRAAA